jgi:predicted nucleotidyltransferase
MDINKIKKVVSEWANTLTIKVEICLFGSRSKGSSTANSDLDLALELLEPMSLSDRTLFWIDHHKKWEGELSKLLNMKVDLQLYEPDRSKRIKCSIKESSILLYSARK